MKKILTALALVLAATTAQAQPLYGINLSGGEFKGLENGSQLPLPADVQSYYDAGFKLIRLPIKASQIDSPAFAKIEGVVKQAIQLNIPIIIDRHEYNWPAVDEQVAFWVKVSQKLPKSDLVQFDLMNEPSNFDDPVLTNDFSQWARDSRLIVAGIRAQGVTNRIWLEYPGWSSIYRFDKNDRKTTNCSSAACGLSQQGNINDPLGKTGIEGHSYFNQGGSGTSAHCTYNTTTNHSNIPNFALQVQAFNMPSLIGEAAFGKTKSCDAIADIVLKELKQPQPGLYGITWWGGGKHWPASYIFYTPLDGKNYTVRLTGK